MKRNKLFSRAVSAVLTLAMLCSMLPGSVLGVSAQSEGGEPLAGKTISILGDSISTFAGYIPTADGVNLEHRTFYPNAAIQTVEQLQGGGEESTSMAMRYDDRYDLNGKTVEIVDAGTPTSWQVGYGVEENAVPDTAVVTLDGDTLIATGIGTAQVKIDGVLHEVRVEAAPLSVFLLMGQSNMFGNDGNKGQSVANEDGQAYSTHTSYADLTVETAAYYVPSALSGTYSQINEMGTKEILSSYPVNSIADSGDGKIGMDSGIAYRWHEMTGDKVWTINVAHAGSAISTWLPGKANYNEAIAAYAAAKETLEKEIAAGHYELKEFGYFWCQGCADTSRSAQQYVNDYLTMHEAFQSAVTVDHDANPATGELPLQFGAIIPIRSGRDYQSAYREGVYENELAGNYYCSYTDLKMSGPRAAQIWMGNNPELEDIFNVTLDGDRWVYMPDGSDGVAEYFAEKYLDGRIDYPVQVKQADSWYTPTKPEQMHDSIHYRQVGYNEMGLNAAENLVYYLGRAEMPEEDFEVKLYSWDGFTEVNEIPASVVGKSQTLIVPVCSPIYRSKEIEVSLSEGLRYEYYDLLADSITTAGTMTVEGTGKSVDVMAGELNSYIWEFDGAELVSAALEGDKENVLEKMSGTTADGVFSKTQYAMEKPVMLLHDQPWILEWKCSGPWNSESNSGSMLLCSEQKAGSTGSVYLFKSTRNWLLAFGEYASGKHLQSGIALGNYGIDASQEHTYRLENRVPADGSNMIWLYVDGQEIGAMDQEFAGTVAQNRTTDYLNGKDLVFGYIGAGDFSLNNGSIDYVRIWEAGEPEILSIDLRYDDRYDVTGKTVEILDSDPEAVVTLAGDTLIATGIGTAKVRIDGVLYKITVEKAKINLVMVVGQSNSGNHFPNATSAVTCPPGTAYYWKYGADMPEDYVQPSMGFHAPLLAELYAQSVAAGDPVKNVLLWEEGYTSKNGQSITAWAVENNGTISTQGTDGAAQMVRDCLAYYEQHSDKYEIVNRIVFCNHGTTDHMMDPQRYINLFTAMWERLKEAGMEYLAFLRVRGAHSLNTAENMDVYYNAASSAQFEMVRNRDDMFMATTLAESWTGPASTVHSIDVSNYITVVETYGKQAEYSDKYGNRASYADGILTTTMKELYGSNNKVHYGIFGYGLIGADAARNMYAALNGKTAAKVVQTDSSGKKSAEHISAMGETHTLNIDGLEDNLSFYPSCGSPKGTMSITVLTDEADITERVISRETSDFGTIDTKRLRSYIAPVITVSYTYAGKTEEVNYILEFEHPCNSGHSYQSVVTPPTCTEQGYTTHTCTLCGDHYVDSKTAALGHKEVTVLGKAATCTEAGLTDGKKCERCGEVTVEQEEILASGHSFAPAVENGKLYEVCACGEKQEGCFLTMEGNTLSVTLKYELQPTTLYAARYEDGILTEVWIKEVTQEVTAVEFTGNTGDIKVFFLTDHYVPWLSAKTL